MRKNKGEILVELRLINEPQLVECQVESEKTGVSIDQCVRDKKFATDQDVAKAYAQYASLPYVDTITDKMADLDILAKVPLKFLRDNEVMPVVIDGHMTILTADPFDFQS